MKGVSSRGIPLALLFIVAMFIKKLRLVDEAHELEPTLHLAHPSAQFPFGCGEGGVDLLLAVSTGITKAISLAAGVALVAMLIGTLVGARAGLRGGLVERVVERVAELTQAFPSVVLALVVVSAVRVPSRIHLAIVFSMTAWAGFARLALAETKVLRGAPFVEAARALGRKEVGVLFRHIVPQLLPIAGVQWGATAAGIVISEASLGFLGFVARGDASLGELLSQGVVTMLRAPHVLFVATGGVLVTSSALLYAGTMAQTRAK